MAGKSGEGSFAQQRQQRLLERLRARGSVVVSEVAPEFGVSELTVRRDINALAARGLITRVHGGAILAESRSVPQASTEDAGRSTSPARFTFGMVVPSLDYYWPWVIAGVRAACAGAQARLILRSAHYDNADIRKQVHSLVNRSGVDGVLVPPTMGLPESEVLLKWLDDLPVPVVLVDRQPPDDLQTSLEWVTADHAAGAALAVRHLHDQGHRRIGLVVGSGSEDAAETSTTQSTSHIRRGWLDAVRRLDPDSEPYFRRTGWVHHPDLLDRIDTVLAEVRAGEITALVLHPDRLTIPFVQHCLDVGVAVPGDIAIVAYDDELANLAEPPLTGVRPPKQHIGRMAVELLTARLLEGWQRPPHRVTIRPTLHPRTSTEG
jgi:DNA-binding LacI/PurR family transcriptional regulator